VWAAASLFAYYLFNGKNGMAWHGIILAMYKFTIIIIMQTRISKEDFFSAG